MGIFVTTGNSVESKFLNFCDRVIFTRKKSAREEMPRTGKHGGRVARPGKAGYRWPQRNPGAGGRPGVRRDGGPKAAGAFPRM